MQLMLVSAKAGSWYDIPSPSERMADLGAVAKYDRLPQEFSILVWNTYKGKKPSFKQDLLAISQNKDIVMIEEAFMTDDLEVFFDSQFDFHSWFACSFDYKKNGFKTGVMTSSKVRAQTSSYTVAPYREIVGNTPKVTLYNTYKMPGRGPNLMVANIHAINSVTAAMHKAHIDQVFQVLASNPGPAVLGGDFNTWSKKKLEYLQTKAQKSGFVEVNFPNGADRKMTFGYPLDHIFLKGLCAKDSHVYGDIMGSDHKAMSVKVKPCP